MANVIYTIPDHLLDLAYQTYYLSPNSDLFTRNQLQRKPIPPLGLDNLALWTSDALQDLAATIASINREKLGVKGKKLQLLYFSDDEGTLQAISLQDLMNSFLAPLALDGSNIGKETIYGASIRKNTLTKDQYGLQSINTEAMKDLAVTAGKLFGQIPLSKMIASGKKCLLMGTAGSHFYTEKVADNNSQSWYVFCNDPNAANISLNSLATIWNYTPYTFTGIKLTDKTVGLTKLVTEATGGFLISGAGNTGVEILPVQDKDFWKIAVRTSTSGGKVTLKGLPEICANYANSIDGSCLKINTVAGSKVTDGSLPKTKLQNAGQISPFAMGYIAPNGGAQRVFNYKSSRLSLGLYKITFLTPAPNATYIVIFGNDDNGGNYVTNTYVASGSRTVNGFNVQIWGAGVAPQDEGFNFVVYAF